jgi:exonuclease I
MPPTSHESVLGRIAELRETSARLRPLAHDRHLQNRLISVDEDLDEAIRLILDSVEIEKRAYRSRVADLMVARAAAHLHAVDTAVRIGLMTPE